MIYGILILVWLAIGIFVGSLIGMAGLAIKLLADLWKEGVRVEEERSKR